MNLSLRNLFSNILIFVLILFVSCQKKDPLSFIPENSKTVGYLNISNKAINNYKVGLESFITSQTDTNSILNEVILNSSDLENIEIYIGKVSMKNYIYIISGKDIGKLLKKRMQIDKEIPNFEYKEIYNDKLMFVSPYDADIILCSEEVDIIRSSLNKKRERSILDDSIFSEKYKEIDRKSNKWLILFDSLVMRKMFIPFQKSGLDSLLVFYLNDYESFVYQQNQEQKNNIFIESKNIGVERVKIIEEDFNSIVKLLQIFNIEEKYKAYKFYEINLQNNNNKFKIIIR